MATPSTIRAPQNLILDALRTRLAAFCADSRDVTIHAPVFVGTGVNDMTVSGAALVTDETTYEIEIVSTGGEERFRWSTDGGTTWHYEVDSSVLGFLIGDGTDIYIDQGIYVSFVNATGHVVTDTWTFTVSPDVPLHAHEFPAIRDLRVYGPAVGDIASFPSASIWWVTEEADMPHAVTCSGQFAIQIQVHRPSFALMEQEFMELLYDIRRVLNRKPAFNDVDLLVYKGIDRGTLLQDDARGEYLVRNIYFNILFTEKSI